jgi:hypothetical protein
MADIRVLTGETKCCSGFSLSKIAYNWDLEIVEQKQHVRAKHKFCTMSGLRNGRQLHQPQTCPSITAMDNHSHATTKKSGHSRFKPKPTL